MAERVTRRDVEAAFARAIPAELRAERVGQERGADGLATNAHNIGKLFLDYAACYGGWEVGIYSDGDSGGGYCHGTPPWGLRGRKPAREFVAWLDGVAAGRKLGQVAA